VSHPPPSGYDPPPDQDANRKRRNKIAAGTVLTGAASIATILTLFLTVGQQQPQPSTNTPTGNGVNTPANAYPVNVETNFLNSCEANGALSVCQCSLTWFEHHVSMARFQQDEADLTQGFTPADIANVTQACGQ
jgi:hypothetical protein